MDVIDVNDLQHVQLELDGGLAVVTMGTHDDDLNILSSSLLFELGLALEVTEANAKVHALVLTGSAKAFSAGGDLQDMANIHDVYGGREFALAGQDVLNSLAALPFPTVAALDGLALGGGLELALACDLRVAGPKANLGLPEVGLGLIPGFGGTQRLPKLIGQSRALDLILTGRSVDANEALQLGLVNRVAEDALDAAKDLARLTLPHGPIALGLAKEAVNRGLASTLSHGLEIEADLFGMAMTTQDAQEGMKAFLEKRKAEFKGH
ncbi:MAG: enoyl-CoA hydratase-related protein [Deinococcota bacterium]